MGLKSGTDFEIILAALEGWESEIESDMIQVLYFLIDAEMNLEIIEDFVRFNEKPFSETLLGTLDFMRGFLLIEECKQRYKKGRYEYYIGITKNGREFLKRSSKNGNRELIERVKKNTLSLKEQGIEEMSKRAKELL